MKFLFVTLLLFIPFFSLAGINYNQNFPYSLLSVESDFTLIQLPDEKLYLVNEKTNFKGCEKILDASAYAWNIDSRKYRKPLENKGLDISKENEKQLHYIMLSDTPMNKKLSIEKQIEQKEKEGELYCEALSANFNNKNKGT